MTAKHTPGPWRAVPGCPEWTVEADGRGEVWNVAVVCDDCDDSDTEANARLIAAAPDLLAALKDMRAHYHVLGFNADQRRKEADAAIKLAEEGRK